MEGSSPRYELRARFCGALDWTCPWCGHLNRHRLDRTSWEVRCKGKHCKHGFAVGMRFGSLAANRRRGIRRLPPSDVTFPLAEQFDWHYGDPVHRSHDDEPNEN